MEGVPQFEVSRSLITEGVKLADLLTDHAAVFPSKGEMRKMVQGGGVSVNKEKFPTLCSRYRRYAPQRPIYPRAARQEELLPHQSN